MEAKVKTFLTDCDVFLLLIGESYGWIPTVGPKADSGLSVTHLEYRQANDQKLPILPFLKKLTYDTDHKSEDARKRDAFRAEVSGWSAGQFVGSFELASDLADSAGRALIELLTEDFVSRRIRERAKTVEATTRILSEQLGSAIAPEIVIPPHLVEAVKRRKVILFAGSGISQSAGLPSAAALGEYLARDLRDQPEYARGAGAAAFATVATDVALYFDRDYLADQVVRVLDPPLGVQPTIAHKWSVLLFDLILTTNWDNLFEAAAADQEQVFHVVTSELDHEPSGRAVLKLHGSVSDPENLLLTEIDIVKMDTLRPKLWHWARRLLSTHTVLVVGSSLRDPSTIRLLSELPRRENGYFVGPRKSGMFDARLRVWNLTGLAADPDAFFAQLGELVSL